MGQFASIQLELTWGGSDDTDDSPQRRLALKHSARAREVIAVALGFEKHDNTGKPVLASDYPEVIDCVARNRILLPPRGEYSLEDVDDVGGVLVVELSSQRTQNAYFQASAVLELAQAVNGDFTTLSRVTIPEDDEYIDKGHNPYFDNSDWSSQNE